MSERYCAKVYGIIWQGIKASTLYYFDHKPSRGEILNRAGDFQRVTRICLTRHSTTVTAERITL